MNFDLTPAFLAAGASILLSVLLDRVPGFSDWWDKKTEKQKKGWMTVLLFLTGLGILVWNCAGEPGGFMHCMANVSWKTVAATFAATLINQPTHQLIKKSDDNEAPRPVASMRR